MPFNPLDNFNQGFASGEQQKISGLQNALAGQMQQGGFDPSASTEFQQLSAFDPQKAAGILNTFTALDNKRQTAFFKDAQKGRELLANGDFEGFSNLLDHRFEAVNKLGGDPQDIVAIAQLFDSGDIEGTMSQLIQAERAGVAGGFLPDPRDSQIKDAKLAQLQGKGGPDSQISIQSSKIYEDGTILGVKKGGGRIVTGPNGEQLTGDKAREVIQEANRQEVDRKKLLSKLSVDASLAKERAKGLVEREKEDISNGVSAAQSIPVLMRADKLLDMVSTGKPEAALLWGKKMLGIESGDSAELENLLGKAIVKQLKPIFGGSFSVGEGEWLKGMSADWGRSTEGNRRLIRQGLSLANKRADVGYSASEGSGDTRTMDVIQGYREWSFPDVNQENDKELSDEDMLSKYLPRGN